MCVSFTRKIISQHVHAHVSREAGLQTVVQDCSRHLGDWLVFYRVRKIQDKQMLPSRAAPIYNKYAKEILQITKTSNYASVALWYLATKQQLAPGTDDTWPKSQQVVFQQLQSRRENDRSPTAFVEAHMPIVPVVGVGQEGYTLIGPSMRLPEKELLALYRRIHGIKSHRWPRKLGTNPMAHHGSIWNHTNFSLVVENQQADAGRDGRT